MSETQLFHLLSGNLYSANKTPEKARKKIAAINADVSLHCEGKNFLDEAASIKTHHLWVGRGFRDDRRGSADTPILLKKKYKFRGQIAVQASDQVKPEKFAPDRIFHAAIFDHPLGRIGVIAAHPNAGGVISSDPVPPTSPSVKQYAASMDVLDNLLTFLEVMGAKPFVGADVNMRKGVDKPWSPYLVFKKHNLAVISHGLDVVAYPRPFVQADVQEVPQNETGADHPWINAKFRKGR